MENYKYYIVEYFGNKISFSYRILNDEIDSYLDYFIVGILNNFIHQPYYELIKLYGGDLKKEIHQYFDRKIGNTDGQDYLFNNIGIIWNLFEINGRTRESQYLWEDILNIVLDWERKTGERIHKGSIYYFWSKTAISQGEFEKGFFLIHSAYEEDVITQNNKLPNTPAFKTVSLRYTDSENLLFRLVEKWAKYLENFINEYNKKYNKSFSLSDFQSKFLDKPPSRDILFSFSYSLAKNYSVEQFPDEIKNGNFLSYYEMKSLSEIILVIDNLIYVSIINPGRHDYRFINLGSKLLFTAKINQNESLGRDHLNDVNQAKDNDFEKCLNELLDQVFVFSSDNFNCQGLESDVSIAYLFRNYTAHNIETFPVISRRFQEIRQSIYNVLFLAIETFY